MPTPSNIYAEKIFSEHPTCLWALDEEYTIDSTKTNITNIKNVEEFRGIKASAYGRSDNWGYYVADKTDDIVYSKNGSMPMVYGASNVTVVYPNDSTNTVKQPSLLIPGKGFLNKSGRYKNMTLEMWLRVTPYANQSVEYTRIVGPVASTDGLYIHRGFLLLKIGRNLKAHFVGEWERPMLVQIHTNANEANLIINGELAFNMQYEDTAFVLPDAVDGLYEQDWIGFYADINTMTMLEVDCVAIYAYAITPTVAKRRFIYGQGVSYPENVNVAYNGLSAFVDYSFANYPMNYSYPQNGKWSSGISNNVLTSGDFMSSPDYDLPNIFVKKNSALVSNQTWLTDSLAVSSTTYPSESFMSFYPTSDYDGGYLKFDSLKILQDQLKSIATTFLPGSDIDTKQSILKLVNNANGDYLHIFLKDKVVKFESYISKTTYSVNSITLTSANTNHKVTIGFDIDIIKNNSSLYLTNFFTNIANISMYVAGDETFTNLFSGMFANISLFNNKTDMSKYVVNETSGIITGLNGESYTQNYASYGLSVRKIIGNLYLDIASVGSWQDYVPLSYLAQPTIVNGVKKYSLSFIQFNLNYPLPQVGSDGYFTGGQIFNTSVMFVKTSEATNITNGTVTNLYKNGIVKNTEVDIEYRVVDNSIIYLPEGIDLEQYSILIKIDIDNPGIIENPVHLKTLELASQILNSNKSATIGTRFGVNVSSFASSSINSFRIYKSSTPHMFLTGKTGIEILESVADSGISLKLNYGGAASYALSAIQMNIKYNQRTFPTSGNPVLLFDITSTEKRLKVYMQASTDGGASSTLITKLVASNGTETTFTDIDYFLNGHIGTPKIYAKEWNMLGLRFKTPIRLTQTDPGYFKIVGPILINNISTYKLSNLEERQSYIFRYWSEVKSDGSTNFTWSDVSSGSATWGSKIYTSISSIAGVDLETIYKIYTGTNKINITEDAQFDHSVGNSSIKLKFKKYKYIVYTDVKWQSLTSRPA